MKIENLHNNTERLIANFEIDKHKSEWGIIWISNGTYDGGGNIIRANILAINDG